MVVSAQPVAPSTGITLATGAFFALQQVHLERPGRRGHDPLVHEVVHLDEGVVPVAAHDLALLAQQGDRGLELLAVEGVGVLDPQLGLVVLQVEGGVGDVDGAVEGLDPALVGLAVGELLSSNTTPQLVGGSLKTLVLYMSTFEPHW